MKFKPGIVATLLIAAFSTAALGAAVFQVAWKGALRDTHGGDTHANVRLADLPRSADLYAVGPVAGLAGEITIVDGKLLLAEVEHGKIKTRSDYSKGASFLVWATVPQWRAAVPVGASIGSQADLEKVIEAKAREAGLGVGQPFPFLLKGSFDNVKYHVVRPPQGGAGHGGAVGPADSALNAEATGKSATVVGFFSRNHEGVFTHRGSHAHLHVVLENGDSGHVDELRVGPDVQLLLPRT
jgi:acetolactate decarboxylase